MKLKLILKQNIDLQIVLVALIFYAAACLGYFLTFENTAALPTWPPSGIAFALIILLGRSAWPGITIGALIANLMAYWNNPAISIQSTILISIAVAAGNTLEALIGNFLLKKLIHHDYPFTNTKNAFRFLFVALVMCAAGASISVCALYINGVIPESSMLRMAFSWWIGDVVGVLLFTPFILSCAEKHQYTLTKDKVLEVAIFIGLTLGIVFLLQADYFREAIERSLPFLVLPLLLWLAFRFELVVAMAGVLIVALLAIYFTTHLNGPFVLEQPYHSMLLLQIFIGVMSISTLVLSATVHERMEAQRKLLEFNETLETNVLQRTQALHDEISTRKVTEENLQRTNLELSKRNNELDNFVYSVSHDLRAPIASVLGLINLAKKDRDATMKDVYLDMIHTSAQQQDYFIKEILDQSRNARLDIKREEILFQPMIDETFNQLRHITAAGKSVERIIRINQDKPFFCDKWRLKVILNNIISNSIRYRNGKDPVIKVNVEVSEGQANLRIEDNGKGIDREHLGNVFGMFYRATDDGAGSGLGLYIVKEAVDKLNGSINIDSEVGKGTTVHMEIPEVVH